MKSDPWSALKLCMISCFYSMLFEPRLLVSMSHSNVWINIFSVQLLCHTIMGDFPLFSTHIFQPDEPLGRIVWDLVTRVRHVPWKKCHILCMERVHVKSATNYVSEHVPFYLFMFYGSQQYTSTVLEDSHLILSSDYYYYLPVTPVSSSNITLHIYLM